ncbi:MAG: hypothetical protein C5B55_06300 [Blastocatellia bacterium]|nr:MAG: hypothetical protein C5B55_06300 [Blastocatellia bacterium]
MKVTQRAMTLYLVIALPLMLNACQSGGTNREATDSSSSANANTSAKPAAPKVNADEIRAVLSAHDKALSEKSLDGVMATFSTDPNTVVLGTGPEERWVGPQEIRGAYTEMFKDYDPGTLNCDCNEFKTAGAADDGSMAWLAATCHCKDSLQSKSRDYKMNVSATVAKQGGAWKFVSLHMSNAFQPPVTK